MPLLKQLAGGKLEVASPMAAPELCCAMACLCGRNTPCGRAFATHVFKECRFFYMFFYMYGPEGLSWVSSPVLSLLA